MNNDIVTKARLNAALGTEGNMEFKHNDIVTVDKMNKAIAEGGGGVLVVDVMVVKDITETYYDKYVSTSTFTYEDVKNAYDSGKAIVCRFTMDPGDGTSSEYFEVFDLGLYEFSRSTFHFEHTKMSNTEFIQFEMFCSKSGDNTHWQFATNKMKFQTAS